MNLNEYKRKDYCPQGNMAITEIGSLKNEKVILKKMVPRLRNQKIFLQRWHQEIATTMFLSKYINVPKVIGYGNTPEPWYIQEWIEGINLRQWIEKRRYPLSDADRDLVIEMVLQMIDMIEVMSKFGIVHRDLTPENIIVDKNHVVYIIDWGLAFINEEWDDKVEEYEDNEYSRKRLTECGRRHGKVGYACPEQYDSFTDFPNSKNDMYTIVILLIELITGKSIFGGHDNYDEIIKTQRCINSSEILSQFTDDELLISLWPFIIGDIKRREKRLSELKKN